MPYNNDWWDYLKARQDSYLEHSAKGSVWVNKKYDYITPGGTYVYPKSVMKGWSSYREPTGNRTYGRQASQNKGSVSKSMFSARGKTAARGTAAEKSNVRAGSGQTSTSSNRHVGTPAGTGKTLFTPLGKPVNNNGTRTPISLNTPSYSKYGGSGTDRIVTDAGEGVDRISARTRIGDGISGAANWIGDRARDVGNAVSGAYNRFTGGDGLDLGDFARAGRSVMNRFTAPKVESLSSNAPQIQSMQRTASVNPHFSRAQAEDSGGTQREKGLGERVGDWIGDRARDVSNVASRVGEAATDAYNRFTGGDGLDIGDFGRAATNLGRNARERVVDAWNNRPDFAGAASRTIDDVGRGASNAYDRLTGKELGETWNRIAGGDDHLNVSDITNRLPDSVTDAAEWAKGMGRRVVNGAQDIWNNRPDLPNIGDAVTDATEFAKGLGRRVTNGAQDIWNNRPDLPNIGDAVTDAAEYAKGLGRRVVNGAQDIWNNRPDLPYPGDVATDAAEYVKGLGRRAVSAAQDVWNNRPDVVGAANNFVDRNITGTTVQNEVQDYRDRANYFQDLYEQAAQAYVNTGDRRYATRANEYLQSANELNAEASRLNAQDPSLVGRGRNLFDYAGNRVNDAGNAIRAIPGQVQNAINDLPYNTGRLVGGAARSGVDAMIGAGKVAGDVASGIVDGATRKKRKDQK